ncbi:hypothetical protein KI387_002260, partial [Taxus chinensis]
KSGLEKDREYRRVRTSLPNLLLELMTLLCCACEIPTLLISISPSRSSTHVLMQMANTYPSPHSARQAAIGFASPLDTIPENYHDPLNIETSVDGEETAGPSVEKEE